MKASFKNPDDISKLKELLKPCPRDLALFTIGVNCPLYLRNILRIKVKDVINKPIGTFVSIKDPCTGLLQSFELTNDIHATISLVLKSYKFASDDYLFRSERYNRSHRLIIGDPESKRLKSRSATNLIKKWATMVGLSRYFTASSLRKTYGYHAICYWNADPKDIRRALGQYSNKSMLKFLDLPS